MTKPKISKKVSTSLINSLGAGVVPRSGIEHIAVGREKELNSLLQNLNDIAEGVAAFRFIVGNYGSGKSFMLQMIRNYAMQQGFVVADVDLSSGRRLAGSNNEGLATYRELMSRLATNTRPDGGALISILEGWINKIQQEVAKETGKSPNDPGFDDQVETKIREVINYIEDLVHGFDFGSVIIAYWRSYRLDREELKNGSLRWLRGEFNTKTEARTALALGVRVIIDDETWYDYIKLLAKFVAEIGYKGLLILIDEAVNLYQISTTVTREKNYNRLLGMFNDTMQCKAENLGIFIGGTTKFLEDPNRGLFADPAWRRRTKESRFVTQANVQEYVGTVMRLNPLTEREILTLLQRLTEIHALNFGYEKKLQDSDLKAFIQEIITRLGAEALLTPGEIIRDFISVLNILYQNSEIKFSELINGDNFKLTAGGKDPHLDDDVAEFSF